VRTKFINYRPVYPRTRLWLRIAALGLFMVLSFKVYASGSAYLAVCRAVDTAENDFGSVETSELQAAFDAVSEEKESSQQILDTLSQSEDGIKLNKLLSVVGGHKEQGIEILQITTETMTGFGPSLEAVTQFITNLSDELGVEIEANNVLQLTQFGTAVGFELGF
jgi:hypothetical protein